jgi:hypothetical protein
VREQITDGHVSGDGWSAPLDGGGERGAPPRGGGGAAVLLLHGFPDLWYGWRHQMAALAARGYRAVAPDLRGYGDSAAPPDASSYTTFHVVGDLVALIADLGQPQVRVSTTHQSVSRAAVRSSPHTKLRATRCSWWGMTGAPWLSEEDHYMCVFQVPIASTTPAV